jgi:hypothetical protein
MLMQHFDNAFVRAPVQDSTALDVFSDDLMGSISSNIIC